MRAQHDRAVLCLRVLSTGFCPADLGKSPDASYSMNSGFGLLSEALKEGAKLAARAVCEAQFPMGALEALVIILLVVDRHTV